jgi:hypothetical protein
MPAALSNNARDPTISSFYALEQTSRSKRVNYTPMPRAKEGLSPTDSRGGDTQRSSDLRALRISLAHCVAVTICHSACTLLLSLDLAAQDKPGLAPAPSEDLVWEATLERARRSTGLHSRQRSRPSTRGSRACPHWNHRLWAPSQLRSSHWRLAMRQPSACSTPATTPSRVLPGGEPKRGHAACDRIGSGRCPDGFPANAAAMEDAKQMSIRGSSRAAIDRGIALALAFRLRP